MWKGKRGRGHSCDPLSSSKRRQQTHRGDQSSDMTYVTEGISRSLGSVCLSWICNLDPFEQFQIGCWQHLIPVCLFLTDHLVILVLLPTPHRIVCLCCCLSDTEPATVFLNCLPVFQLTFELQLFWVFCAAIGFIHHLLHISDGLLPGTVWDT